MNACKHDERFKGVFLLPSPAGGCIACALEQALAELEMERANHAACTRMRLRLEEAREADIARLEEALAEIAALKAQREAVCPYVRTSRDGTSYCELAQTVGEVKDK